MAKFASWVDAAVEYDSELDMAVPSLIRLGETDRETATAVLAELASIVDNVLCGGLLAPVLDGGSGYHASGARYDRISTVTIFRDPETREFLASWRLRDRDVRPERTLLVVETISSCDGTALFFRYDDAPPTIASWHGPDAAAAVGLFPDSRCLPMRAPTSIREEQKK